MEEKQIEQMTESILDSVKTLLGLGTDNSDFDPNILMNINAALLILFQNGIGTKSPFVITGKEETYEDFITDPGTVGMVKMFLFYKVKIWFDSESTSSILIEQYDKTANEFLWRMREYEEHKDAFK